MEAKVNIALEAARKGSKELMWFLDQLDKLDVIEKGPSDYVTQVDIKVESIIIEELQKNFPNHNYISEEVGTIKGSDEGIDSTWIIDPLDGTTNFIHGFPYFAISIAYLEKNKIKHAVVIDVTRHEEYTASQGKGSFLNDKRIRVSNRKGLKGALLSNSSHDTEESPIKHDNISTFRALYSHGLTIRRTGSAVLDIANVAAGRLDGFWGSGLKSWDLAAGALLVQEAGGLVSNFLGQPKFLEGGNIICSTTKCFKPILQSVKPFISIES